MMRGWALSQTSVEELHRVGWCNEFSLMTMLPPSPPPPHHLSLSLHSSPPSLSFSSPPSLFFTSFPSSLPFSLSSSLPLSLSHFLPLLPPSLSLSLYTLTNAHTRIQRIWWWDNHSRFVITTAMVSAESVMTALPCESAHACRSLLQWLGEDWSGWSNSYNHEQCLWNSRGYSRRLRTRYMYCVAGNFGKQLSLILAK